MSVTHFGKPQIMAVMTITSLLTAVGMYLAFAFEMFYLVPIFLLIMSLPVAMTLWFFRDPPRTIPEGEGLILAPADGVVTHLDVTEDKAFPEGKGQRLSIFLSVFNVHLNRAPMSGKVVHVAHHDGKFFDARDDKSHANNEHQDVGIETGDDRCPLIWVRQTAGFIARRIVCTLKSQDEIKKGEVYGMIKFGSRTTIFIPEAAKVTWQVKVGDKVTAGETILGLIG